MRPKGNLSKRELDIDETIKRLLKQFQRRDRERWVSLSFISCQGTIEVLILTSFCVVDKGR
jgi:hypothetical protein